MSDKAPREMPVVEVRYDDHRKVDEIVASDCSVHLERMSNDSWCLIIETAQSRSHFSIGRRGKTLVETTVVEIDMSGGRATPTRQALDYVLPYVHVDVRDKALQIERGEGQPGEKHAL